MNVVLMVVMMAGIMLFMHLGHRQGPAPAPPQPVSTDYAPHHDRENKRKAYVEPDPRRQGDSEPEKDER